MFGLVERFIAAKVLQVSKDHWFGSQVALEALVRFTEEELKHQALFRRIEQMIAGGMRPGYEFSHDPNKVADAVMAASTWAVLALTCHIELFTQVHYRQSIEADHDVSDLIALILAVDGIVQAQATADARYFAAICDRKIQSNEMSMIADGLLGAYRWQYIVSGAQHPRFNQLLDSMIRPESRLRIESALAPLAG